MKIKEYNDMMRYLKRREPAYDKSVNMNKFNKDFVKAKQNAYKNLNPKAKFFVDPATGEYRNTNDPNGEKLLKYIEDFKKDDPRITKLLSDYDTELDRKNKEYKFKDGMVINGNGDRLNSIAEAVKKNDQLDKDIPPTLFSDILDNIKVKGKKVAKKPKPPKPPADPKPNGLDPNPTVVPFPIKPNMPLYEWWKTEIEPKKPDLTLEEYMDIKKKERVFMGGIGRLFSKKNS